MHSALINARTSTVWAVLTDTGDLTVWESGITAVDGELRNGGRVRFHTTGTGRRSVRVRVQQVPGRVMTWTASLPLGLSKTIRTFTLAPAEGKTRFHVKDEHSGLLHRLGGHTLHLSDRPLADFVKSVKKRAELLDRL
ncbi:SRPBCC family protein [Arthrobacter sp. ISL-5]|uniref:SRPBCC family protein n=1 Tax=Arthrobacter sp. ISL-5 TaxID=2819111 RepID=UPI001BE98D79|nr:SRPBCC family protein [Arthrobacter sp. ISL-5]MBT2552842.1 SRPBCC family protein [Arthrobacter sp. ISL-5]